MSTRRLRFETLGPRHAELLFEELRDPALYTYIPDDPPASLEALTRRFAHLAVGGRGDEIWRNWVMFLERGRAVGTLQATVYPDHHALVAYTVLPAYWRMGLGAEAVTWMLDEIRRNDAVARVEALIDTRNHASIGLVQKIGFRRIETIPNAAILKGAPSDEYRYEKHLSCAGPVVD